MQHLKNHMIKDLYNIVLEYTLSEKEIAEKKYKIVIEDLKKSISYYNVLKYYIAETFYIQFAPVEENLTFYMYRFIPENNIFKYFCDFSKYKTFKMVKETCYLCEDCNRYYTKKGLNAHTKTKGHLLGSNKENLCITNQYLRRLLNEIRQLSDEIPIPIKMAIDDTIYRIMDN